LPKLALRAGARLPLGATVRNDGVNFALFSPRATRVWLRLYAHADDVEPIAELELDAKEHRTYGFWHVLVGGAKPGWCYGEQACAPSLNSARSSCPPVLMS